MQEFDDGSRIQANMKYFDNQDESKLHLNYKNTNAEVICDADAQDAKAQCLNSCDKKDKVCKQTCNDAYSADIQECRDQFNYVIENTYSGLKTLSMYDILKLVGFE